MKAFLPSTRWQRIAALVLAAVVVVAGGVVAGKAAHNARLLEKWGWLERAVRFTGAPLDRAEVAKYGKHVERPKLPEGCSATFTHEVKMPSGQWCKTQHVTTGSSMWSFSLAVLRLDELLLAAATSPVPGVTSAVSGCGGTASIAVTKAIDGNPFMAPPAWSEAEQAAWSAWAALVPPEYSATLLSSAQYLLAATVTAGGIGGASDVEYKVVGWVELDGVGYVWIGDTEWILAGTLAVANLRLREQRNESSVGRYTVPRRWKDFSGAFMWFTDFDPPTTTVATLGGMSVSDTVDLSPDPVTGEVDFEAAAANPSAFYHSLSYGPGAGNWQLNTSYVEVRDVACSSHAPNTYCSFWSTCSAADEPADWTVSVDPPEGAVWHFFNAGATFKLHAVAAPSSPPTTFGALTWMLGPVKFNMLPGRGGHGGDFPVAGGWRCDMSVRRYVNETETETVWIGPGESDWYAMGYTSKATDQGAKLNTGTVSFGVIGGNVDGDWLTANGELLELTEVGGEAVPTLDNRRVKLLLPSLESPLSGEYWGEVIDLVWAEQSANIPPGYATPPSLWAAGTGATVAGTYGERWTITGATGKITRALLSRKHARMAYLATGYEVGKTAYIDDWIMIARANIFLPQDPPEVAAVCAVEDVTNYDNSRCLIFTFEGGYPTGLPDNWQADATLKLTFDTFANLQDSCYTPAEYGGVDIRFGTDGFFECELASNEFTFTGRKLTPTDTSSSLLFDLGQLRRTYGVDLRDVTGLDLTLPQAEFWFADMRLAKDPDAHGVVAPATYPDFCAQPATDPWNWLQCAMGFGGTFEGVPCLNVPEGTENTPFSKDIQLGIKQTQHLQWNPMWLAAQETPPTYDPTYVRNLNVRMVQLLVRQEQFTGTTLGAAVAGATTDDEANSLGFLYPWDLQRSSSDDNSMYGGIHVQALTHAAPLAPIVVRGVWITHGRAHGMAYQDGEFVRGDGTSSDDPAAGQSLFWRQPEGGGAWQTIGSFSPGVTGRWCSPPALEDGYIYGVKTTTGATVPDSTSNFVTREYADLYSWFPTSGMGRPALWIEPTSGIAHLAFVNSGSVHYCQSDPWSASGGFRGWRYGGLNPIKGTPQTIAVFEGGYTDPSVVVMPTREVIVSARSTVSPYAVTLKRSLDQGETWEAVAVGTLTTGLTQAALWQKRGVLQLVGIVGANAVYRRSDDGGVNAANLDEGGAKTATIAAADDEQPAVAVDPTGTPYAVINIGGTLAVYVSQDGGNNWAESDTI